MQAPNRRCDEAPGGGLQGEASMTWWGEIYAKSATLSIPGSSPAHRAVERGLSGTHVAARRAYLHSRWRRARGVAGGAGTPRPTKSCMLRVRASDAHNAGAVLNRTIRKRDSIFAASAFEASHTFALRCLRQKHTARRLPTFAGAATPSSQDIRRYASRISPGDGGNVFVGTSRGMLMMRSSWCWEIPVTRVTHLSDVRKHILAARICVLGELTTLDHMMLRLLSHCRPCSDA